MKELIFKAEWDCITREGVPDFSKKWNEYRDNMGEFEERYHKQEKEYFKLNKEYIIAHRKRFDKALYFEFNDNDFGKEIEDMMVNNFITQITAVLNWCQPWVMDDTIERELDKLFDKDTLLVKMKYWFITQYMLNNIIWRDNAKEYDIERFDKYYEKAKKTVDYIFRGARLVTGTNEEITQLVKEEHGHYQDKEILESGDIDKYWLNGDAFILRIIDNKVCIVDSYGYIAQNLCIQKHF